MRYTLYPTDVHGNANVNEGFRCRTVSAARKRAKSDGLRSYVVYDYVTAGYALTVVNGQVQ